MGLTCTSPARSRSSTRNTPASSRGPGRQTLRKQFVNALDVPPIQTVIPWQQVGLVLGGLVAISLVSILLMTAQVARPSISQTLRLNED